LLHELKLSHVLAAVQRVVAQCAHLSAKHIGSKAALCTLTALWRAYTCISLPTTISCRQQTPADNNLLTRGEEADWKQHRLQVAFDCNFAMVLLQARLSLLRALAAVWRVGEEQVQLYTALGKPSLQTSQTEATIGRATLPVLTTHSKQPGLTSAPNSNKVRSRAISLVDLLLHSLG